MRHALCRLMVLASVCLVPVDRATAAIPEPVKIPDGLIAGASGAVPGVRVFKGIPFAAPPVGERRWQPPQAPQSWQGVRQATRFSANCMQRSAGGGAFPPYGGDRSATTMSEDCLYLNVYTTAASADARQPVMVWIHGGAYTSGAGAIYQGEDLARKGVVVVTLNYRLGVFGFLAHPELSRESANHVSGNYAFLDQIAALRWVQKSIAAFGGDPSRVTIFGESAGSWSVNNLVASPLARGLFHRAIGESGGQFAITSTLAENEQLGARFAEQGGLASLAALRAASAETLNAMTQFSTSATVDGWFLPQDVRTTFESGRQNDVPMLIGSNADEGSIFTSAETTAASFRSRAERDFGGEATAYLALYPFSGDDGARRAQAASMRDSVFGWEMRTWARLQEKSGRSKAYLYYFSHVPPRENAAWYGAQHGAEIPYVFDWPAGRHSLSISWTDRDRTLAEQISTYWVNFAATGDPNGDGLPRWQPYAAADDEAMEFGTTVGMIEVPQKAALDFLDGVRERSRQARRSR